MKKQTKKSRILAFIVVDVLISIIIAATLFFWAFNLAQHYGGGRYREYNKKPDDRLSAAVRDAIGKDYNYHGKEESDSGVTEYEFQVKKLEKDVITNLLNTLNDAVKNEQGKIRVWVGIKIPGALENVLYLENFSDDGLDKADYDGMYAIRIRKPNVANDTCFASPSVYTEIEGIRKLTINVEMKKQAEKEKIDWYELWPDLEEIEVVAR